MNKRNLQPKRALRSVLFVLLLSVVGMKNALAQNQIATLQHNDSITGVFYGQNAFVEAHNAAETGDIITLSSGTFNKCDITKAICIRGAGCVYDSLIQVAPTIIPGEFLLKNNDISFEGVWCTGFVVSHGLNDNISFVKCNINKTGYVDGYQPHNETNWQFVNCIIKEFVSFHTYGGVLNCFSGMTIINSVVRFTIHNHTDVYSPTIINNSIILFDNEQTINNILAYNSIIATTSGHEVSNCFFYNCIGIKTGDTSLFEGQIAANVLEVDGYEDVFETFAGTVFNENWYQLKEEIATGFLGQDGTEVGIYGGMMPYNPRPSYMKMKRCNVAPRSTIDNKLSVDIEVLTND